MWPTFELSSYFSALTQPGHPCNLKKADTPTCFFFFFWLNSRYSYINRHWTHLYTAKSWKSKQKEKKEKANKHIYLRHSPRIRYLNKEKSLAWTQKFQFYFYPSGLACILLKTTTSSKERHKEAQSWTLGFNTRWHSAINLYKNGWMIIDPKMERGKEKKKTQN